MATWTYDPSALATSALYQTRFLIGDTLAGDQQLFDEEVNFALATYGNTYLAAAECCRNLAAKFSRKVDLVQGELKTNYSNMAKAYAARALDLEQRGMARGGVLPYAGGISEMDKRSQEDDPDRVKPQFNIGMTDNLLPVGPGSGNETPGNPDGGAGP